MKYRFYDLEKEDLFRCLETDPEKGLTREQALKRLKEDGKNTVNPVLKAPVRGYVLHVITDLMALLLLVVAFILLIFERDAGMAVMAALLILSYTVTLISYKNAQKLLEKLGYLGKPKVKVLRNGKLMTVPEEHLVQGDVFLLNRGDMVPCDARLIESEQLTILESNLFDEDHSTKKSAEFLHAGRLSPREALNMVYASTVVLGGRGKAVAVATGTDTLVCRMKKNKPIAACHKLDLILKIKKYSSRCSLVLTAMVFTVTLLKFLLTGAPVELFLSSLAVAVAAIPELYTAFAYIAVAEGMNSALYKGKKEPKGAFIKNPTVLPVLKDLNCLMLPLDCLYCQDEERMAEVVEGNEVISLSEEVPEKAKRILRYALVSTGLYGRERLILRNEQSENIYSREQEVILMAGEKAGIYNKELEERYPVLDHLDKGEGGSYFETTLVHFGGQDISVLRGDVETVLSLCTGFNDHGKIVEMDGYLKGELLHTAKRLMQNSRTVLAIATKNNRYNTLRRLSDAQSDMIFEGMISIEKPFLPGAAQMISSCKKNNVKVVAYTREENRENRFRARALGIATEEAQMVRERELSAFEEEIFRIKMKEYTLLEGFDAEQLKFAVDVLENDYHLKVGMLGKNLGGVYPLCSASVAFCEGNLDENDKKGEIHDPVFTGKRGGNKISSCQALEYVSDVVIPEPDMKGRGGILTMVESIRSAKWIYRNIFLILSYLSVTSAMRIGALLCSFNGVAYLTPVQILSASLIFDLGAVFVMALEKPKTRYYQEKIPFLEREQGYFSMQFGFALFGELLGVLTVGFSKFLLKRGILLPNQVSTFVFVTFLFLAMALLIFVLRQNTKPFKDFRFSRAFLFQVLLLTGALTLLSFLPVVGKLFDFTVLKWKLWAFAMVLPLVTLTVLSALRVFFQFFKKEETKTKKEKRKEP